MRSVDFPRFAHARGGAGRLFRERGIRSEPRAGIEMPRVAGAKAGAALFVALYFFSQASGKRGDPHGRPLALDQVHVLFGCKNLHHFAARSPRREHLGRGWRNRLVDQHKLRARRIACDARKQALAVTVAEFADQLTGCKDSGRKSCHAARDKGKGSGWAPFPSNRRAASSKAASSAPPMARRGACPRKAKLRSAERV